MNEGGLTIWSCQYEQAYGTVSAGTGPVLSCALLERTCIHYVDTATVYTSKSHAGRHAQSKMQPVHYSTYLLY